MKKKKQIIWMTCEKIKSVEKAPFCNLIPTHLLTMQVKKIFANNNTIFTKKTEIKFQYCVARRKKVQIHCLTKWCLFACVCVCVWMKHTGKRSRNQNHENHFELWTSIWEFIDCFTSVSRGKNKDGKRKRNQQKQV